MRCGFSLRPFDSAHDKLAQSKRSAFTLIELLVVIGILGILAGIVITAVAPNRQLAAANDAWRHAAKREISNAITQYVIDTGALPAGIPTGSSNALPICREGMAGETGCVNLDVLVTDDYITALPVDTVESSGALIGFTIYEAPGGFVTIDADHLGESGTSGGSTGGATGGSTGGGEGSNCPELPASGGNGSPEDPYQIDSCEGIENIATIGMSFSYALTNHVDCDGVSYVSPGDWATRFTGTFDGQGCSISNLTILGGDNFKGLFGGTSATAVIENIALIDVNISGGGDAIGAVVGQHDGTIRNAYVTGIVSGANGVGGMVGYMNGTAVIENSYASADVTATSWSGGGLVGAAYETCIISDSFAVGDVNMGGGVSGYTEAGVTMDNVYWNDHAGNPATCYDGGNTGCTAISDNEAYFYDNANTPLSSWNFSTIWQEEVSALPTLQ